FVRTVRAQPYGQAMDGQGRLAVDTPDDLAFVEAVHARLAAKAGEASLADLQLLLEREPELKALPAPAKSSRTRSSAAQERLALIRCDGGGKFGYGHVKRMVALARALRDHQGIGTVFALNGSEDACLPIRRAGFEVTMLGHGTTLKTMVRANIPDLLIL